MADYSHSGAALAARLERGEVIVFPTCPFVLPEGEDRQFLLAQQLAGRSHKNISYNPRTGRVGGFRRSRAGQAERLRALLDRFSGDAATWLSKKLPEYARAWKLDQVSFRPEEEATRQLRLTARNDLLHIDAFPSRPTNGWRLLRLFVNINSDEPRIWVTSDTFSELLARYGYNVGLPYDADSNWFQRLGLKAAGLFHPGGVERSAYDAFMLRFHNFLKRNETFQERCTKRYWSFPPGSAWLVMTDGVSHAALRGRFALEHSYFVAPHTLVLPDQAPATLLQCGGPPSAQKLAA